MHFVFHRSSNAHSQLKLEGAIENEHCQGFLAKFWRREAMKDGLVSPAQRPTAAATAGPARYGGRVTTVVKGQQNNRNTFNYATTALLRALTTFPKWQNGRKCTKLRTTPIFAHTQSWPGDTQSDRQPLLHGYQLLWGILCRLFAAETRFTLKGCLRLNLSFGKV